MKNFIRTIILTTALFTLMSLNVLAKEPSNQLYAMTTVVTDYQDGTLYCEDFNGMVWTIECDQEDWMIGDICAMVMDNNGTDVIYDDVIVTYKYDGFVSNWGYTSDGRHWGWRYNF